MGMERTGKVLPLFRKLSPGEETLLRFFEQMDSDRKSSLLDVAESLSWSSTEEGKIYHEQKERDFQIRCEQRQQLGLLIKSPGAQPENYPVN